MTGKLYVVYESSFDIGSPRESDAQPTILLITLDKEKAYNKLLDEYFNTTKFNYCEYVSDYKKYEEYFDFNEHDKNFGRVGIIEYEMEEN